MQVGKVVGTLVSTQKAESLIGYKLLIVQPMDCKGANVKDEVVAVDTVGAGIGETVLLCFGSAAKAVLERKDVPVDVTVVGIIDSIENS